MSIQISTMLTGVEIDEIAHEGLDGAVEGAGALYREHLANEGFGLDMRICPSLHLALSQESTLCFELSSCVPEVYPSIFPLRPDGGQKSTH